MKKNSIFRAIIFILVFNLIVFIVYMGGQMIEGSLVSIQTPQASVRDSVQQVDRLPIGKIVFSVPDTMQVGKNYQAISSITASLADSILFMNIDTNINQPKGKQMIKVSPRMVIRLIDPSGENFIVQALTSEEQIISSRSNTIWRWNLKPVNDGANMLMLNVSVILNDQDGSGRKDMTVYEKTINVEASYARSVSTFFSGNWQWILSSIFFPLIIFWYREGKKKKVSELF
ncbi:hypothetical protein [Pedobacter steynii]